MRYSTLALGGICAGMMLTCASRAATVQWSYPGTSMIFQVVADGKGGCAFSRVFLPQQGELTWLDKAGAVVYQTGLSNAIVGGVIACTDKYVVFADARPERVVFLVDSSGSAVQVPAPPGSVNRSPGQFPFCQRRLYDTKGFFAVNTNGASTEVTLVRYSNK